MGQQSIPNHMASLVRDTFSNALCWPSKRKKTSDQPSDSPRHFSKSLRPCQQAYLGTKTSQHLRQHSNDSPPFPEAAPTPYFQAIFTEHEKNVRNHTKATRNNPKRNKRHRSAPGTEKPLPPLPILTTFSNKSSSTVTEIREDKELTAGKWALLQTMNSARMLQGLPPMVLDLKMTDQVQAFANTLPAYPDIESDDYQTTLMDRNAASRNANNDRSLDDILSIYISSDSSCDASMRSGSSVYSVPNSSTETLTSEITVATPITMQAARASMICYSPISTIDRFAGPLSPATFLPKPTLPPPATPLLPQPLRFQPSTPQLRTNLTARLVSPPGIGALAAAEAWCSGKYRHFYEPHAGMHPSTLTAQQEHIHEALGCSCYARIAFETVTDARWAVAGIGRSPKEAGGRWVVVLSPSPSSSTASSVAASLRSAVISPISTFPPSASSMPSMPKPVHSRETSSSSGASAMTISPLTPKSSVPSGLGIVSPISISTLDGRIGRLGKGFVKKEESWGQEQWDAARRIELSGQGGAWKMNAGGAWETEEKWWR